MTNQEKNLNKLIEIIGNVDITDSEMQSLEWLSGWEVSTINNICNVLEKMKNRGAGRKPKANAEMIQVFKKEGKTQEWVARQMDISISTVQRHWNR